MNSEAYQCSTLYSNLKRFAEKDPTGISFAVFKLRRLTSEELRDLMLRAKGELNVARRSNSAYLNAANVPAHTRVPSDVCITLLNSNEFAHVY